jgi:hypothetical protein
MVRPVCGDDEEEGVMCYPSPKGRHAWGLGKSLGRLIYLPGICVPSRRKEFGKTDQAAEQVGLDGVLRFIAGFKSET